MLILIFKPSFVFASISSGVTEKNQNLFEWQDNFLEDNIEYDKDNTDAHIYLGSVEEGGGYLQLPGMGFTPAISLQEKGFDQVAVSKDGLETLIFDGDDMVIDESKSYIPPKGHKLKDATGVAAKQDGYSLWAATDKYVSRLEFDGTQMIENPFLQLSGRNINSISTQPYKDEIAMLQYGDSDLGIIEYYQMKLSGEPGMEKLIEFDLDNILKGNTENGGEIPIGDNLSIPTSDLGNPVDIAVKPGAYDVVYATSNAVIYMQYDGNSYINNPYLTFSTNDMSELENIRGVGINEQGGVTLLSAGQEDKVVTLELDTANSQFSYIDSTDIFTSDTAEEGYNDAISLALKPGGYDFAVMRRDGMVEYYNYLGNGEFQLNKTLSHDLVELPDELFHSPRTYTSRFIDLTKHESIDEGWVVLDISADISVKDGITNEITPWNRTAVEPSVKFFLDIKHNNGYTRYPGNENGLSPGSVMSVSELTNNEFKNAEEVRVVAKLEGKTKSPRIENITLRAYNFTVDNIRMQMFPNISYLEEFSEFQDTEMPFTIYPDFLPDGENFPSEYLKNSSTLAKPIPVQKDGHVFIEVITLGNDLEKVRGYFSHQNNVFIDNDTTDFIDFNRVSSVGNKSVWLGEILISENSDLAFLQSGPERGMEISFDYVKITDKYLGESREIPHEGFLHQTFIEIIDNENLHPKNFYDVYLIR